MKGGQIETETTLEQTTVCLMPCVFVVAFLHLFCILVYVKNPEYIMRKDKHTFVQIKSGKKVKILFY